MAWILTPPDKETVDAVAASKARVAAMPNNQWMLEPPPGRAPSIGRSVADFLLPPTGGPAVFQRVADALVPVDADQPTAPEAIWDTLKTPTGAGGAIGTVLPPILSMIPHPATKAVGTALNTPVGRTLLGGGGAAVGALIEGKDPLGEGATTMGWNALGEGVGGLGGKVVRSLPMVKGRIAEGQARGVTDAMRGVSPDLAAAVEANRGALAPTLRGPTTSAALQETAFGKSGQEALSAAFERGMVEVDGLVGNATIPVRGALKAAYDAMPTLAKDQLVGAPIVTPTTTPAVPWTTSLTPRPRPAPRLTGFTPRQAQEVIAWVGSEAFTDSPLGQGVGAIPQQKLWVDALNDTVRGLNLIDPQASAKFLEIRAPYAAGQSYLEMLREGAEGPFRSYGNRLNMDENAMRSFVSKNRMELAEKLGKEGFAALIDALGGAQPGTKSLMTPGGGGAGDALAQVYGRGQGGSPQIAGSLIRTVFPNIGYQAAGRAPYTLPPALQAILDAGLQGAGGAGLRGPVAPRP